MAHTGKQEMRAAGCSLTNPKASGRQKQEEKVRGTEGKHEPNKKVVTKHCSSSDNPAE